TSAHEARAGSQIRGKASSLTYNAAALRRRTASGHDPCRVSKCTQQRTATPRADDRPEAGPASTAAAGGEMPCPVSYGLNYLPHVLRAIPRDGSTLAAGNGGLLAVPRLRLAVPPLIGAEPADLRLLPVLIPEQG